MCKPRYHSNRLSKKQNSFDKGDKIVPHPPVFETLFFKQKGILHDNLRKTFHFIVYNNILTLKMHSEKKKKLGLKYWDSI